MSETPSPEETYRIAFSAYQYAYPLVSMELTRRQAVNVADATAVTMRAPTNQFAHVRAYPDADNRQVVRLNFDTLYSSAWVDVSAEPIILSVPDMHGRYYLLPMLDMWTDVFCVVGTRTTGSGAGLYCLTSRDFAGPVPEAAVRIDAPTPRFWILGRTKTNGPGDYAAVHRI